MAVILYKPFARLFAPYILYRKKEKKKKIFLVIALAVYGTIQYEHEMDTPIIEKTIIIKVG